ncbi:MAG: phosphoglucosamine mutase [Ilumatobacteraceae bacterium]
MALRFGTDGVRGIALTELTTDFAAVLGRAAVDVLGGGRWLVGRDPRESGPALESAVAAGVAARGAESLLAGVLPTPALAWLSSVLDVPAVMVTASHNPWHDNGLKVFAAGGLKLGDDIEQRIEQAIRREATARVETRDGADSLHSTRIDGAADYVRHMVDASASLEGLHVVIDCAHGAMSNVAPDVLATLGAQVDVLHASPDGRNINDRCGATDTAALQAAVVDRGAGLGLAFDGDGDRVIAVDERGQVVDGDRLLALAALRLRDRGELRGSTVVVTVMSNLGFHRAMRAAGIDVATTAVGDRYVLEALERGGFSLGGEQSGHIIYRDLATTCDGLLAGLQLCAALRELGNTTSLASLAGGVMASYPQVLVNVAVRERHPDAAGELADEIAAAEAALGEEGRVLVRASGTEPLVRVMVEAATDGVARRIAENLAETVRRRWA